MKRYNIKTEYNHFACEDQLSIVEDPLGDWVKWNDYVAVITRQLYIGLQTNTQMELQNTLIEDLHKQIDDLHETIHLLLTMDEGEQCE